MNLELKHLSPYLPCGLKAIYNEENEENTVVTILGTSILDKERHYQIKFKDGIVGLFIANDIKPILRPLSDLNKKKQIAEYFCSFYDHLERINPSTHETKNCALMLDGTIEMQYYNDYQFLFAWHFDVFGLIEKGLAIDINTLK